MTESTNERAPLGHPAEAEVPVHDVEPRPDGAEESGALEDSEAYELAVEDGAPLAAPIEGDQGRSAGEDGAVEDGAGGDTAGDDGGPVFIEPEPEADRR